ncbi:MAG: PDZ domain-containing protein [Acidobacteria bacterium]|nr:PDZ domain-containing protein [Acidobacteriota bacterium]
MPHRIILFLFLTFLTVALASAQTGLVMRGDAETFALDEMGAVMVQQGDDVKIVVVMPADQRPADYRDVDLQPEDVVLMANGTRIRTVQAIRELYEALDIGAELTLGIRRGREMRLISLVKADPAHLPRVQRMMVTSSGAGGSMTPVLGLGLVLTDREGAVVVQTVLPNAPEAIKDGGPAAGDTIVALNGAAATDASSFATRYEELASGDTLRITFRHESREKTIDLPKPEAPAGPAVIRQTR